MSIVIDEAGLRKLGDAIREACLKVPVAQGPAALARELERSAPTGTFREVLSRGGWYRMGGVVDAAGNHVSDQLERWAQEQLAAHGDDMHALAEHHAASGFRATHLNGKTHYWVAAIGAAATDFLQVEIEELQEVVCHTLFADDSVPGGIEELIDTGEAANRANQPIGMPFYQLRRVVHVGDFLAAMRAQKSEPQTVHRFIDAWTRSSAGSAVVFSHHWVMAVREHLDRFRQTIHHATPVAALNGLPPKFDSGFGVRGRALHDALLRFDRQVGYPMAWFFHSLTARNVPREVAVAVVEDMHSSFSYLPERDLAVIKDWLHRPYGF